MRALVLFDILNVSFHLDPLSKAILDPCDMDGISEFNLERVFQGVNAEVPLLVSLPDDDDT